MRSETPNLPPYAIYFKTHYRIMQRAYIWSKLSRRDFSYETVLSRAAAKLELHLTPADLHRLAGLWYQPINLASTIDQGIPRMLQQLRDAGTKLGIVLIRLCRRIVGLAFGHRRHPRVFPGRIYSSQVRFRKPHPRIFEIALNLIGVPAARTLFIGDLLKADITGAKKAGMHTVWKPAPKSFKNGICPSLPRRHHADHTIPKTTHLPEVLHKYGWRPTHVAAQV